MATLIEIGVILILAVIGPIAGSAIGVLKKPSDRFIFNMLAFAAGVMLTVSFLELIPSAIQISSIQIALLGVAVGAVVMYLVETSVPKIDAQFSLTDAHSTHSKISKKTPLFLVIGMFFHNIPEGMAIAIGFFTNFTFTLTIALAIALHHIPEGISTAAPYYAITKNKKKAFIVSSITALPTLLGFVIAYTLYYFIPNFAIGFIAAVTAGVMLYISGNELIPASSHRVTSHKTIFALMLGIMFVMGLKLFL